MDTSKIEGYENMTAEEKIATLESYEIPTPEVKDDKTIQKYKDLVSKANSEAANWKRQFRETQSEAERMQAEREEERLAMEEQLKTYKANERINGYKAKLMENGFSADVANTIANDMPEGIPESFFEAQKNLFVEREQTIRAEALKSQPTITSGQGVSPNNVEDASIAAFRKSVLGY